MYMYAKFSDDRLRNGKALAGRKSDNNNERMNKNNDRSAWRPDSGSEKKRYSGSRRLWCKEMFDYSKVLVD